MSINVADGFMRAYVEAMLRVVATTILIGICSFPLWSYLLTEKPITPLIFGPFIINIISLLGRDSFEAHRLDWRILILNMTSASAASFAGAFASRDTNYWMYAACGAGTFASFIGSLSFYKRNHRFTKQIDRRLSLLKVTILCLPTIGLIWGLAYAVGDNLGQNLWIGFLMAIPIFFGCLASLLFPNGTNECDIGVGNPLLWISCRILLAGSVPFFWVWFLYSLFCFIVMQLWTGKTWPSFGRFLYSIQETELRYSSISLSLAVYQLILTLQSPLGTLCTSFPPINHVEIKEINSFQILVKANFEGECSFLSYWKEVAMERIAEYLEMLRNFYQSEQGIDTCYTHYMFEQTGSIIVMSLLLACSIMYMLRRVKGYRGDQGFWQPVFFIASAVVTSLYYRTPEEIRSMGTKGAISSMNWSYEAICSMSLSVFGCLLTAFFSIFRVRNDKMVRVVTDTDIATIGGHRRLLHYWTFASLFVLGATIMSLLMNGYIPYERNYHEEFQYYADKPKLGFPSGDEYDLLLPFYLSKGSGSRFLIGQNCSNFYDCKNAIVAKDPNDCHVGFNTSDLISFIFEQPTARGSFFSIGLRDLLSDELLVIGYTGLVASILLICSLCYPVLDDLAITFTIGMGSIFAIALPFRLTELRGFSRINSIVDWQVGVLGILLFLACVLLFVLRVSRTISLLMPFSSAEEISNFLQCTDKDYSLKEFVQEYYPYMDPERHWTYQELVDGSRAKILSSGLTYEGFDRVPEYSIELGKKEAIDADEKKVLG